MSSLPQRPPGRLLGPLVRGPEPGAAMPRGPSESRGRFLAGGGKPDPHLLSARPGSHHPFDRVPAPQAQDPGVRSARRRLLPHAGLRIRSKCPRSRVRCRACLGWTKISAEALALSHDLGHPPFGHAGEAALDRCMARFGGFDHNAQALVAGDASRASLRRVRRSQPDVGDARRAGQAQRSAIWRRVRIARDLPEAIADFHWDLELSTHAGLEAQIASLSDDIAYVNHDIDDGLRAGLFARRGAVRRAAGRADLRGDRPRASQFGTGAPDRRGGQAGDHARWSAI